MKRILSLLLAALTLLGVMLIPATAASIPGRVPDVDYSRIKENVTLRRKIEIDIGDRRFTGYLQNGKQLSEQEVDRIIRAVMAERGITTAKLRRANYIIKKAGEATGIDLDMLEQLGIKFATGAIGIDNITDAYAVLNGDKELTSTAANALIGQIIGEVAEHYFGGYVSMLVSGLWSCTEMIGQELARLLEENDDLREALEAHIMLNFFYNACNRRIEEAERGVKGNSWQIVCDQTVWCDQTLFDVKVTQYWHLSCELNRTDNLYGDRDDPTNYGGVYRGTMTIDIWHDLTNYDEQFYEKVAMRFFPISKLKGILRQTHSYNGRSTLTKSLISTDVEIHLDQDNMTSSGMTEFFSLKGFSDSSSFKTDHTVRCTTPHHWWNDRGYLDMTIPTEIGPVRLQNNIYLDYRFSGGMSGDNRYPCVKFSGYDNFSDIRTSGAVSTYQKSLDDHTTVDAPFIFDYQIYDDLRSGQGMLTVVGG